jgi:8-oxo-dGTP diphosphatase
MQYARICAKFVVRLLTNSMTQPQPIGACAVLLNPEGKVLLGKRKNSYLSGMYGLPGGRVEVNEPLALTIAREVQEETGMVIPQLRYLGVVRENQGSYDFIHFVFVAEGVTETPVLCEPDKCEGWEWLELDSFTGDVLPGHKAAFEMYRKGEMSVDLVESN